MSGLDFAEFMLKASIAGLFGAMYAVLGFHLATRIFGPLSIQSNQKLNVVVTRD